MREAVQKLLSRAQRPLLLAHQQPDGDALGATLGLMHLLAEQGKAPLVYSAGPIPEEYEFLPGLNQLLTEVPSAGDIDLAVVLDCHEAMRTGRASGDFLQNFEPVAIVDHHQGQAELGQAAWVDPSYAATCEMLAVLAGEMGWSLTAEAATCLFVGLQTDTGSFRYANTTPLSFQVAARLEEAGAEVWPISQEVYATRPQRLKLLGRIMDSLWTSPDGALAVSQVRLKDLAALQAGPQDLEQAVEMIRLIPGVEAAALLREVSTGGVKVSLRSRGQVDVARVAMSLGGGGHKNAAGVTLEGSLKKVRKQIQELLSQSLEAL